ncbi:NlpC/P60 family protein [Streptomyces sp. NPDC001288]|uniref:C40 family peptidase n=1 Tax=Streptomyces sp. NPDC001297 TaxID=3364559 RepID=UPI0036C1D8B4
MAPESRDEVRRRIDSLYDQAENATGNYNATRAMNGGSRSRGVPLFKRPRRDDPGLESIAREWFDGARSRLGPSVPAALPADRQPARPGPRRPVSAMAADLIGQLEDSGSARPELTAGPSADAAIEVVREPAERAQRELTAGSPAALPPGPSAAPKELPAAAPRRATPGASKTRSQLKIAKAREILSQRTGRRAVAALEPAAPAPAPAARTAWPAAEAQPPAQHWPAPAGMPGQYGDTGAFAADALTGTGAFAAVTVTETGAIPVIPATDTGSFRAMSPGDTGGIPAIPTLDTGGFRIMSPGAPQPQNPADTGGFRVMAPGGNGGLPGAAPMDSAVASAVSPGDTGSFRVMTPGATGTFRMPDDTGSFPAMTPTDTGSFPAMTPADTGAFPAMAPADTGAFPTAVPGQAPLAGGSYPGAAVAYPGGPQAFVEAVPPAVQYAMPSADFGTGGLPVAAPAVDMGGYATGYPAAPAMAAVPQPMPTAVADPPWAMPATPPAPVEPPLAMAAAASLAAAPLPVATVPQMPAVVTAAVPTVPPVAVAGPLPTAPPAAPPFVAAAVAEPGKAMKALAFARAQIGRPCVWGATGPESYDCSSLTQAAWRAAGVSLPRSAPEQAFAGSPLTPAAVEPGDLVFFFDDDSHVGIYAGDGMMIHAPSPGASIREESIYNAGESAIHRVVRPA